MENNKSLDRLLIDLTERAKELNCLYEVQQLITGSENDIDTICNGIIQAVPDGWQFTDVCQVRIKLYDKVYQTEGFAETDWVQSADIKVQDEIIGSFEVCYSEERPEADEGPFLKEERKLIETISEQLGIHLLHLQLRKVFNNKELLQETQKTEWGVILDLLRQTDPKLLIRVSRKMVNYLCWTGIKEAENLLEHFSPGSREADDLMKEANSPYQTQATSDSMELSYKIFDTAGRYLSEQELLNSIQKWIREDRSGFLVNVLENMGSTLSEISGAIERYHHLRQQGLELSPPRELSFRVALVRRMLSDQPGFIDIAKKFIEVDDFNELMHRIIYPSGSHGKIGGKGAGLFLAKHILKKSKKHREFFEEIKTPKTWYLTSDGLQNFMTYNNLEDIMEQKYKEIGQVRQEYPYVVHVFKNSPLSPEIIKGLSLALDDFGEVPLVIRSSSLLEDRLGAAFAGKYKSLFISNQGSKGKRLSEVIDAVSEIYASIFGPDPVEYRTEQGLLDYHEEMGILIQEVVGRKAGKYFLPAFGGVAFSHNEFRWSSRIKREDGLIRIVPGLGTRAVDRLSDDYPILVAPGQPRLRVNVSLDEIIRYSPKNVDVINLETSSFETISVRKLLKECGSDYPAVTQVVSVLTENHIQLPRALGTDYSKESFVVTFEGLISRTKFVGQVKAILDELQEHYENPIDIEFAHDGEHFYLLQCRSQSHGAEHKPAAIPSNIPKDKVVFSANRFISNGIVPDISHVVYVNPQKYSEVASLQDLLAVGRAVGKLNKILPKRQFILMGPGRWGSRGDIKLGVSITYSDINNSAMLIEIARKQKDYVPDLSFGTHFFQDLVEANIRYLPLYPDDKGIIFNEDILENSANILADILPDFAHLSDVVRVIDVSAAAGGGSLQILMNSETEKALGILVDSSDCISAETEDLEPGEVIEKADIHWRWRMRVVEGIAEALDPKRFGVKGFYLFGSTKNAAAGPESDIDILVHFIGTKQQRSELLTWLEGWSMSLSRINFLRTGYMTDGLLDVHLVTDEDIEKRTSYAAKIGAVSDAARPLALGKNVNSN